MKNKIGTILLVIMVTFTMSFTTVFADASSIQPAETQTAGTENVSGDAQDTPNPVDPVDAASGDASDTTSATDSNVVPTTPDGAKDQPVLAGETSLDFDTKDIGLKAKLNGETWGKPYTFQYTIVPEDGAPAPENLTASSVVTVKPNDKTAETVIDFGQITFTEEGTYLYTVKQQKITNSKDRSADFFIKNDLAERSVEITITKDPNTDTLKAAASVTGGKSFKNTFKDVSRMESVIGMYYRPSKHNTSKTSLPGKYKHANLYQCESRSSAKGMYLVWYTVKGAKKYFIYKKSGLHGKWKYKAKVKGYMHISYRDSAVKDGHYYEYKIIACKSKSGKKPSIKASDNYNTMGTYFMRKPKVTDKGSTVKWPSYSNADGMRVEVSKNGVFVGSRVYMIPKGINSFKIPGYANKAGGYRFVRVMPYKKYDGHFHYGLPWLNKNTYRNFVTKVTFVVKDKYLNAVSKHQNKKDVKEMLSEAKQKMWGWDTTQGIAYDGKYAYMNVENRYANSIKVIKMDPARNFKVLKVSKPVKGCHGNDITYNSDTKRLYITYSYFNKRYVARMNPKTMKYEGRNYIKVPYNIAGPHGHKAINNLNCYNEIHYDNVKKQYLLKKKESHSMLVLDKNFKVVRYMRIHERVKITNQNMQATPEFFFRVQSNYQSNKKNNYVTVFDWHGTYISHFNLNFNNVLGKAELENIFFIGDKMYGACYKKWWDTKPVGSIVKIDKVKRHGKYVFKTKKVTKANQKKVKQLRRTSYIFRINLFG